MILPLRVKEAIISQIPKIPVVHACHIVLLSLLLIYWHPQDAYQVGQKKGHFKKWPFINRLHHKPVVPNRDGGTKLRMFSSQFIG
jgi:hypothetical protein